MPRIKYEHIPYPSAQEVEDADRYRLAVWYRFLQSPGLNAAIAEVDKKSQLITMNREKVILDRIIIRFEEMGGWDSPLSKEVGWNELHHLHS